MAPQPGDHGASLGMPEASPDVLFVVDGEGDIVRASGDISGMLGFSVDALTAKSVADVLEGDSATRLVGQVKTMMRTGSDSSAVILGELSAIRSDGTHVAVEAVLVVLESGRSSDGSVLVTLRDDRRSALRRDLEHQNRLHLESSNRDLEAFASVAAHDLQEPLRKIRAFSDRVSHAIEAGELDRAIDFLERVDAAAGRMQMLLDDLLMLARVSGQEPDRSRIDLTAIAREVAQELQSVAPESTITVSDLPTVDADSVRMRQLFTNLIGNALKYRRRNVDNVVDVGGGFEGDWVRVQISDNGIGFDNEYRERIFGAFQRLHGRAEYEGSGVGLALCRAIVVRHGGTLTADGHPGEGATFTIMLPGLTT